MHRKRMKFDEGEGAYKGILLTNSGTIEILLHLNTLMRALLLPEYFLNFKMI